jgi:hypothetical protein
MLMSMMACAQTKLTATAIQTSETNSDSNFRFQKMIPGKFSYFNVDALGNMYFINETNQLKKINSNGDSVGIFNDVKKYGQPSRIDVNNPLKILVYYKNYSTVVVLDRFLSFRNSINFRKENVFKVQAIATSYDNNIWIFDEQDFKLKKINDDGTTINETSDWRQIFDEAPTPTEIIDNNNLVYLYDAQKGFYIFDYYGSLKNNLPFIGWQHIAVANNSIMGFVNDTIQRYELNSFILKTYKLPSFFKDYIDIIALNGKVYLLKKEGIEIYELL